MRKVKTLREVNQVFDLLGIKEVGKRCQHKRGNYVYELPFKTCYASGSTVPIKFAVYTTGYVRRVEGAFTCYQINKVRQEPEYWKDYKWNEEQTKQVWTGKYRKRDCSKRILIDNHEDRMVNLCNYILKNFYGKGSLVYKIGEWTRKQMEENHNIMMEQWNKEREGVSYNKPDDSGFFSKAAQEYIANDVQVVINGHRYNLA